jgi:GNAT superfamily N-acetyltransferase
MHAISIPSFPQVIAPAIRVREATRFDAARLQAAMARCPQGTDLVVTLVNAPDFFARSRIYATAKTFLAEADGKIAGSAAVAVRDVVIGGAARRVAYEFQVFVAPEHRRQGVAQRLRGAIGAYLATERVDLTTAIVAAGNAPSERLFSGGGFRPVRDLAVRFVRTDVRQTEPAAGRIRPAVPDDYAVAARLLNRTWREHDLAVLWDADLVAAFLDRTPGLDRRSLLVREIEGEIVACAALWAWDEVTRFQVEHVAPTLQPRFPTFRAGEALRHNGLCLIAARSAADLAPLIRHAARLTRAAGKDLLDLVADAADPLWAASDGLPSSTVPLRLHAKALTAGVSIRSDRLLFADVLDL